MNFLKYIYKQRLHSMMFMLFAMIISNVMYSLLITPLSINSSIIGISVGLVYCLFYEWILSTERNIKDD